MFFGTLCAVSTHVQPVSRNATLRQCTGTCVQVIDVVNDRVTVLIFSFPEDDELLDKWFKAIKKKRWKPSPNFKLCSTHFFDRDLERLSATVVRVKEGAVPLIFAEAQPKTTKAVSLDDQNFWDIFLLKSTSEPSEYKTRLLRS